MTFDDCWELLVTDENELLIPFDPDGEYEEEEGSIYLTAWAQSYREVQRTRREAGDLGRVVQDELVGLGRVEHVVGEGRRELRELTLDLVEALLRRALERHARQLGAADRRLEDPLLRLVEQTPPAAGAAALTKSPAAAPPRPRAGTSQRAAVRKPRAKPRHTEQPRGLCIPQ